VTEQFLDTRGLYYRTNAFTPGRPTLVFLHGVSGSSSAWRPYEARFASHYNVLTCDLRGHGRSIKYPRCRDYAMGCFVEDLHALLESTGIDQCVLISHSFAVLIALEFLRIHQRRVGAAVLVSGHFDVGRSPGAGLLERALTRVDYLERWPARLRPGTHIDYGRYRQTGDWNLRRMMADAGNTTWRVFLYCTRHAYAVHAEALLPEINVPVLLVHGRNDSIFPVESSVQMAARIPKATLVIIDEADHIVVLNRPREVADAIEHFVGRIWPATRPPASLRTHTPTQVEETDHDRTRGEVLCEADRS
jgi:pimeloyl-ACP methyl ester carboxylesterase